MATEFTRADALREYITGAGSDGGVQADPALALGNYRSSTPALTYGITIADAITGVAVDYASGGNVRGSGTLFAPDANTLQWRPYGSTQKGPPAFFVGPNEVGVVESNEATGAYLRITGNPPFSVGQSAITLRYLVSHAFGFPEVSEANAAAGVNHYRATIIRNESSGPVTLFKRWVAALAGAGDSRGAALSAAGAGTITSNTTLASWPDSGYVRIVKNDGTLREIAYYNSRTSNSLNVTVRGLLGSATAAGLSTDTVWPVPGVALALAVDGVEAFGSNIATIADANTAPGGVTWKTGITAADGIAVATINVGEQFGVWFWRHVPAGAKASGAQLVKFSESFSAY